MRTSFSAKIILFLFFCFSLFLHLYQIDSAPKAALVDEADLAYNAYSIVHTGKGEFGTPHPLLFRSFGDQKLPLYIYASAIPVKLLGFNILSIRLVAALSASFLVLIIFFLLRELAFEEMSSLVGAGIAAVSSWTFLLGRFGWESSVGLFFFSLTLLVLVKCIQQDKLRHFVFGGVLLGLTWYTYIPYRAIALILFLIFLVIVKTNVKKKLVYIVLFFILISPSLPSLIHATGSARFRQTTILYDQVNTLNVNDLRLFCNEYTRQLLCSVFINKPIEITYTALKTLGRILSISYLFISGETDGFLQNIGKFALLPIFMAPFYLLGIIQIYIKNKELRKKRVNIFLALSFVACLLPILITKSPVRIQMSSLFPFILIVSIFGYAVFVSKTKNNLWHYLVFFLLLLYGLILLFYFIDISVRKNYGNERFIANTAIYLGKQYSKVHAIYIDPAFPDFITFYAFYNSVNPVFYHDTVVRGPEDNGGFQHVMELGKIKLYYEDYTKIACIAKETSENDLLLTQHNLAKEKNKDILPVFTGQVPDHLAFGYVYRLADIVTGNDCKDQAK